MLFPTVDFAIFLVLVFTAHWLLNHLSQPWKWFMIGASYVFYAWWDWRFVLLLVGISILAQLGAIAVARTRSPRPRLVVNGIAVVLLLVPLAFFKYYGFFAVNVTNTLASLGVEPSIPLIQVVLPVGISFFTFMAIAYVVDVYRGDFEVASWTDTFLYLSFFPHLVAGPIVRPHELIPQLRERRDERHTDIAIGVAQLLGFQFPRNFDRPYAAHSIQDFWRRWHMTLSRWLRDYLYIPLGGNRRGERRTYENIVVTMLLGGLWHGAAWTFVFWGAFPGGLLGPHRLRSRTAPLAADATPALAVGRRAATFA